MIAKEITLEQLVQRVKFGPNREWMDLYFDLVKQALEVTGLKDGDPRLAMSLPLHQTRWHFPVSINFRYVIAAQKTRLDGKAQYQVGLAFASYCRYIPELSRDKYIQESWRFSNFRGEFSEPPYFLRFDNLFEAASLIASSEEVRQCWHDTLLTEVSRAKASTYRRFHQSKVYKLALEKDFRTAILNRAYLESKPVSS